MRRSIIDQYGNRRKGGSRCDVHNLTYGGTEPQNPLPDHVVKKLWEIENSQLRKLFEQAEKGGITITDGMRMEEM